MHPRAHALPHMPHGASKTNDLMYFRSQKKLQGEISLSGSIETDREGNTLELLDVVGVDDTMLEDLHDRESAQRVRSLVKTSLTPRESEDHTAALRPGRRPAPYAAGSRRLLRYFPQLCIAHRKAGLGETPFSDGSACQAQTGAAVMTAAPVLLALSIPPHHSGHLA